MKICEACLIYFQEQFMSCPKCQGPLEEVSFEQALALTRRRSLHNNIVGKDKHHLPDSYQQYHIRSYLKDRSMFLDFDIHKNRLKHGRKIKRFLIAPFNLLALFNLPWFFFNVVTSNLFHMQHTRWCPRCDSKYIPGLHDQNDCDYNIEYFNILDDILSGRFVDTKQLYSQYSKEKRKRGQRSAYFELFTRNVCWEFLWDLLSVGFSILLWVYVAVYISFPMALVLVQKLQQLEAYEWVGLGLR